MICPFILRTLTTLGQFYLLLESPFINEIICPIKSDLFMNAFQKVKILDLNHFMVVTSRHKVKQIKRKFLNWLVFSKNCVGNIFYLMYVN